MIDKFRNCEKFLNFQIMNFKRIILEFWCLRAFVAELIRQEKKNGNN